MKILLYIKRYWILILLVIILIVGYLSSGRSNLWYKLFKKYRESLDKTNKKIEEAIRKRDESVEKIKSDYDKKIDEIDKEAERTFNKYKSEDKLDILAEKLFGGRQ